MARRFKSAAVFSIFASAFAVSIGVLPALAVAAEAVTRQYDVSDLVTSHPSHALPADSQPGPGGAGGGSSVFEPASEQPTAGPKLLSAVRSALSLGDDSNSKAVELIGSSLVVIEPAEGQQTVAMLLEELRLKSNTSVQISIDAVWALAPVGPLPEPAALLADSNAAYARARTVGFNGQTIGVRQVREVSVITGATPIVGANVSVNQFTTEIDRPGVKLEVTPTLQSDGSIVVDVKSESTADLPRSNPPTTRPEDAPILRPDKLVQTLATTIALKPGQPTIVGGITQDASERHGKTMCLVLTASVVPSPAKLFK